MLRKRLFSLLPVVCISLQELSKNSSWTLFHVFVVLALSIHPRKNLWNCTWRCTYETWQTIKRASFPVTTVHKLDFLWGKVTKLVKPNPNSATRKGVSVCSSVVCIWKTGQKAKVTQIQGQSNLVSFLPHVAEESPLWCVAPETQIRVARAKWDVIIAFRDHGNTRMKDPGGCEVCNCVCAHVRGRLRASVPRHLPLCPWGRLRAWVECQCRGWSRVALSAFTRLHFTCHRWLFHLPSLPLILPDNHEYGCCCWAIGSNGRSREKQRSAVIMSPNIAIAVWAACICMTYFVS